MSVVAEQITRKPHDPGPGGSGGDGGINPVAASVLLLVCLLVVAPVAYNSWRKGDRVAATTIVVAPIACVGLWLLAVALTN